MIFRLFHGALGFPGGALDSQEGYGKLKWAGALLSTVYPAWPVCVVPWTGLPCRLRDRFGVHSEQTLFSPRERLKRSQKSAKVEGPEPVPAEASLSAEQGTMTEVKVKTELPDDYIQEVIWQGEAKEDKKAVSKDGTGDVPAEICVVIGGVRNQQTLGECLFMRVSARTKSWGESLASLPLPG